MSAFSFVQYPISSTTVGPFSVSFPYIATYQVEVRKNGTLLVSGTDYTWPTSSTVQLVANAVNGDLIEVRRNTLKKADGSIGRLIDWANSAKITESNLDKADLQCFYLAQEAFDAAANALQLASDGTYDALTRRIKNVGNAVQPQDAVTKAQLDAAALAPVTPTAGSIANIPSGNLASVTVQAALNELQTDVDGRILKSIGTAKGDNITFTASGTPVRKAVGADSTVLMADSSQADGQKWFLPFFHGKCRLSKSGANLVLLPKDGNTIIINSVVQAIPDAGVTLAPAGAAANTTYFIYAYMVGATMTLEFSATGHSAQAGTGVEIKTGDATRTYVGLARTTAGTAWADTPAQRFLSSYFNRRNKALQSATGIAASTNSGAYVECDSSKRAEFVTHGDEDSFLGAFGTMSHGTSGQNVFVGLGIDSAAVVGGDQFETSTTNLNPEAFAIFPQGTGLAEGYHYATLLVRWGGGAGTANVNQGQVTGMVRG